MSKQSQDRFSLEVALNCGWRNCWKYFWPYVGVFTAVGLLVLGPQMLITTLAYFNQSMQAIMLGILAGIGTAVLQDVVALGYLNVQLRVLDGKTIQTRDVFAVFPKFLRYLGAAVLYKLMVFFGYLLFIVPGIIFQIKYQYYGYLILENDLGPIQALKASSKLTQGSKMDLFLFGFVQAGINFLGYLCFFVGSFPAYLVNIIASASVYRQLVQSFEGQELIPAAAGVAPVAGAGTLANLLPGSTPMPVPSDGGPIPDSTARTGSSSQPEAIEANAKPEQQGHREEEQSGSTTLTDSVKLPEAT